MARSHGVRAANPGGARLRRDDDPVREHGDCDRLDVLGDHVVASQRDGARLGHPEQRDSRPWARTERQERAVARVPGRR